MEVPICMLSLAQLLDLLTFPPAAVLAGHAGLDRPVQSVNIMDVPDMIRYLHPDELLLTNAYVMKDDPDQLARLVRDMHDRGCAGLMISSRRFLRSHPKLLLDEANRLGFPVIEPPQGITLGDIANQSIGYILEKKTGQMRYALESHRYFTDILLRGNGLTEIIEALAAVSSLPVILFDDKLDSLAVSSSLSDTAREDLLRKLRPALQDIPPSAAFTRLCLLHQPPGITGSISVYPIHTYQPCGYLVICGEPAGGPNDVDLAAEQAANVIRFEMLKMQAVRERSRRYKNEFFADFIDGRIATEQELLYRGGRYGLSGERKYVTVIAKYDQPHGTKASMTELRLEALYEWLKPELARRGCSCIRFIKNDAVVLLLPEIVPEPSFEEMLADVADAAGLHLHSAVSFGIGKPVDALLDIPTAYREAMEALDFGYSCGKTRFVQYYSNRELIDLFRLIPSKALHAFYRDTIQPFEALEVKERSDLLHTLRVYYNANCRIADTAASLYIHRNTVIYRLDKCTQLLGRDPNNPNDSLRFRVAFLIEPLLHP